MSIQDVGWVLDETDLPPGPKLVLVAIANHADNTDGYCWLKAATIAKEAACSERAVYRIIAALIRNGYVRRDKKRGADGKRRANDYWILTNRPAAKWSWFRADPRDVDDYEDPQDVGGKNASSDSDDMSLESVTLPSESCGPTAIGVSQKILDEPSKTNLRQDDRLMGEERRSYRAPAPLVVDQPRPTVFVYQGTPAFDALVRQRAKEGKGKPPTIQSKEHGYRTGWYFPTLFPPAAPDDGVDNQAAEEFQKYG